MFYPLEPIPSDEDSYISMQEVLRKIRSKRKEKSKTKHNYLVWIMWVIVWK